MTHRFALHVAAVLLAGTASVASGVRTAHAAQKTPNAEDTAGRQSPIRDNADALAALSAVNAHEITSAEIAQNKNVAEPVMRYAQMLHVEHSDNQKKTVQLARDKRLPDAQDNSRVLELRETSRAEQARLAALQGAAFENAYLDAMIKGHADALAMIDNELLQAATMPEVDTHLRNTRVHVAAHLEQARQLKSSRQ